MSEKNFITLKQLSKSVSLSEPTLRYYINLGLLSVDKKERGIRSFKEAKVLKRIKIIKKFLRDGYLLRQMRKELNRKKG